MANSICWECARASGGQGCPWIDKDKAVAGWTVEHHVQHYSGSNEHRTITATVVRRCPLYTTTPVRVIRRRPMYIQQSSLRSICSWAKQ